MIEQVLAVLFYIACTGWFVYEEERENRRYIDVYRYVGCLICKMISVVTLCIVFL